MQLMLPPDCDKLLSNWGRRPHNSVLICHAHLEEVEHGCQLPVLLQLLDGFLDLLRREPALQHCAWHHTGSTATVRVAIRLSVRSLLS